MNPLLQAVVILSTGKLLFALQDVIIKEMSSSYPVAEIVTIRGLVAVPLLLLLIHFTIRLPALMRHHPGVHMLRGLLMFTAFMLFYVALSEISLTTATALFFTAPFFISMLAWPLLGERFGMRRVVAMIAGFAGVLIVLRPGSEAFSPIMLLPIASAFFYAFCQILVRYARLTAPPAIMSLYAALAFVVLGPFVGVLLIPFALEASLSASSKALHLAWAFPAEEDLLLLMATGLTSALGFMCSSNAFQRAEASQIAPFEYIMIIWVTLLSYLVWAEVPDLPTLIGVSIIILSGLYVLRRENRKEKKPIAYTGLSRR